jgi:hypothetical protein
MAAAQVAKLAVLGFAWELSAATINTQRREAAREYFGWEAQLAKLKAYKTRHGDCNAPRHWAEGLGLDRWVDTPRQFTKKLDRGETSGGLTVARVVRLEALGSVWAPPRKAPHVLGPCRGPEYTCARKVLLPAA